MMNAKLTNFVLEQTGDSLEENLKIEIEGYSNMPFWRHDLKMKAAIALLEAVDYKDFIEVGAYEEYCTYINKLEQLIKSMKI